MKHSLRNWSIIASIQLGIIVGGFSLPNHIINGATWYAPILDFGRIALLFGIPVGDGFLLLKVLAIGKRKKTYLKQFIDASNYIEYESIHPIYFTSLTSKQMDSIELAFKNSRNDSIFDASFPFESLQKYLQGTNKNV
ncbi:hypothetical protein [Chamaesiphon sp. VAR_69_metabat_338]|uniref:hypothetical protein n=1 Tax=Chamaesiphon sp. VAR_69_metabat_338 TaxID=2964704 RepID=UPI00286D7117|nr:hypothetical protein [Chamaesiphon sp. VAR_69_metabat_338]